MPPIRRINHGKGHRYEDAAGRAVPGVTTIIGSGVPKPALVNWAARITAEYAVDNWAELSDLTVSERMKRLDRARHTERGSAAVRGTQLHGFADQLAQGREVSFTDELAGHVESYVSFLDDWDEQVVLTEYVVMSHRHGYAGTGDLIADLVSPDDPLRAERWLLDIKTGSRVYGETALQLAAYRYADVYLGADGQENPVPAVDRVGVVHVRADGYDLIPITAGPRQFRDFLYAQQVSRFVGTAGDLVGEALTPPRLLRVV
jgi:hypothetical protein